VQIGLVLLASGMGLAVVLGASGTGLHDPIVQYYAKRQALWLVVGATTLAICARIDYHTWTRWSTAVYVILVVLLLVVLALGHRHYGSQRWISFGGLDFQPSEFAKLALIFVLARHLAGYAGKFSRWRQLLAPLALSALPAGLVVLEPDLGTGLVFLAILFGVVFAAGFSGRRLVTATALLTVLGVVAVVAHLRWGTPLPLHSYQLHRLLAFINPQQHALTWGYQIIQSETAIGSGQLHGTGVFSGGVNGQLGYLSQPQTDFAFASLANMGGFLGAGLALVVLAAIFWRSLGTMALAGDGEGALIAAGIAAALGFQVLLNAGVALGVLPVTGIPLPFISYGGSATVVNFAAIGILQSIRVRRKKIQF
jgi:rod shape determining protein RodA